MRRAAFAIAGLTAALFVALYSWGPDRAPFGTLEGETLDWRFALRGPLAPGGDVVILAIDERSVEALGGWPVPRQILAEAVERLTEAGAKVIGLDLLLLDLEPPTVGGAPGFGDQRLIAAIRDAPPTVLPFAMIFQDGADTAPPRPELIRSALRIRRESDSELGDIPHPASVAAPPDPLLHGAHGAHVTVALDEDGSLRSLNLVLPFAGELYPALPLEAVRLFQAVDADQVIVELDRGVKLGALTVETQSGLRLPVNYYGPPGAFD
jgi:adenylate cyclase